MMKNGVASSGHISYGNPLPNETIDVVGSGSGIRGSTGGSSSSSRICQYQKQKQKVYYHIHDFANQSDMEGEYFASNTIKACGHQWVLLVHPRGSVDEDSTCHLNRITPDTATTTTTTSRSIADDDDSYYVSIVLLYIGKNPETHPLIAKVSIRTNTINNDENKEQQQQQLKFSKGQISYEWPHFSKLKDLIVNDCNNVTGTLTITLEIEVEVEMVSSTLEKKRRSTVWFPQWVYNTTTCNNNNNNSSIGNQLFHSRTKTFDVSFIVISSNSKSNSNNTSTSTHNKKEVVFVGHKCIIELRARLLYDLIVTIEEKELLLLSSNNTCFGDAGHAGDNDNDNDNDENRGTMSCPRLRPSSGNNKNNSTQLIIQLDDDVVDDPCSVFGIFLEFVYTQQVHTITKLKYNDDEHYQKAKSILWVASQFGCTELQLFMESIILEKFLVVEKVLDVLTFLDSHCLLQSSCTLLKETAMTLLYQNPLFMQDTMELLLMDESISSNNNDEQDEDGCSTSTNNPKKSLSDDLFTELLDYVTTATSNNNNNDDDDDRKVYYNYYYSSVVDDGNGTINDADQLDVSSLRERLEKYELELHGNRDVLVERWKVFLRQLHSNTTTTYDKDDDDDDANSVIKNRNKKSQQSSFVVPYASPSFITNRCRCERG